MKYFFHFLYDIQNIRRSIFVILFILFIIVLFMLSGCVNKKDKGPYTNTVEAYRVTWWYLPGVEGWGRPTYGVINIDNGELTLRHAILEGRELGDYRLPYHPIRSFVSVFSKTAELAHQGSVMLTLDNRKNTFPFRCGDQEYNHSTFNNKRIEEGFDVAGYKNADVLKVSSKGNESPILMEHFFVVEKNSRSIPVFIKATNTTDRTINDVVVQVSYTQDFNWSSFGAGNSQNYQQIEAPDSGTAEAFFAFSSGMERGYEFSQNDGCELSYKLNQELNAWDVLINNTSTTLEPGKSIIFSYNLRIIDKPLKRITKNNFISKNELDLLEFTNIQLIEFKNAPVNSDERVTIHDVIQNIDKPKVRGLNPRAGMPYIIENLSILKDWGCNLAIVAGGNPQAIEHGHKLGMEMFVAGSGHFDSGEPLTVEHLLKNTNLKPAEYPDAYGQDEDHYFWYNLKPTLDFEAEFGKSMSTATQEEKVRYWSRCLVNKWRMALDEVHEYDPQGKIWFYTPTPGPANIDPLDYYDPFMQEISLLGDELTVFPFYYGIDYGHVEYMMKKWKNNGVNRAVFLPGGPSYSKPGQFIRAVTSARRGGADGACGFHFPVSEEPDQEWRWKSVMLASQVNFPTPELNAFCFIEEPAELLEALAVSDVCVFSSDSDTTVFIQQLKKLLPGKVLGIKHLPEKPLQIGKLYIVIGDDEILQRNDWVYDTGQQDTGADKGVIQMSGNIVSLSGSGTNGIQNAESLFLRFAELAMDESKN